MHLLRARERELLKRVEELAVQLDDNERQKAKQKNEWAEIYGSMKQEIEDLKQDVKMLSIENDKLAKTAKRSTGPTDAARKLKKRELECAALWETLRDMNAHGRGVFDARQMRELLALRALDVKAKRKLGIWLLNILN